MRQHHVVCRDPPPLVQIIDVELIKVLTDCDYENLDRSTKPGECFLVRICLRWLEPKSRDSSNFIERARIIEE